MEAGYERRKVIKEHNMNVVEFCTDSCLKNNYTSFEFTQAQKECLTNCYTKIIKLGNIVNGELNLFVNRE